MNNAPEETRVYELRIQLDGIKPAIWRSVAVPSGITLDRLHDVIQIAMGWLDYHLHLFEVDGRRFSEASTEDGFDDEDEASVGLSEVIKEEGGQLIYTYDFGDDWRHTVTATRIYDIPDGYAMRLRCLDGKRARPPEDVGGLPGFERFHEFGLMEVPEEAPFLRLLSTQEPRLGFVLVDPTIIWPEYDPAIHEEDLAGLEATAPEELAVYCIVTLSEVPEEVTANLRGPICINTGKMLAKQMILVDDRYSTKHSLLKAGEAK
jgi:flagellar assembly factor FliW